MRFSFLMMTSVAAIAWSGVAHAAGPDDKPERRTAWEASRAQDDSDVVTTGVARGRDRLDSATSTSSLKENEISRLQARSLAELVRNIPGIRVEAGSGEGGNNYVIRGLPLVDNGAKYVQLQEDGMPVLEFGDFLQLTPDNIIRADLNVAEVQSIRGGSSSTFASNAPGGVINLISKTGEVEGGSVQLSSGLDYELRRVDFDYGGHLGKDWRFHVGGFYRQGEGPRPVGYSPFNGGQLKLNITHTFAGGYIRFYGKYLDDRYLSYTPMPIGISGTNEKPVFGDVANLSNNKDILQGPGNGTQFFVDPNNNIESVDTRDANHFVVKSVGFDAAFTISDWSIIERFRFSKISGTSLFSAPQTVVPAAVFGGPGAALVYASGPSRGTVIADPANLNGNGLLALSALINFGFDDVTNVSNDLRASRTWPVADGILTTTAGIYGARQALDSSVSVNMLVQDVVGNAKSSYVDVLAGGVFPITTNGVLLYGLPGYQRVGKVYFNILAPYASANFTKGKLAIGASVRYDSGRPNGTTRFNGPPVTQVVDINSDGVISAAEATVATALFSNTSPVDYRYDYLSYSSGINYRFADHLAAFARYSKGARAGADRLHYSPAINAAGKLSNSQAAYDPVRQAEVGVKYRKDGLTLNLTGFYAKSSETTSQVVPDANGLQSLQLVSRSYRAYGLEFEGGIRRGPFSLNAGATYTQAEITAASQQPDIVGNTPRHQPKMFYQVTGQYNSERFTLGSSVIGTTGSYAQDTNILRMPGYTTVGLFGQYRPVDRIELGVSVNNLFDVLAITDINEAAIPATGVVGVRSLNGRTVAASVRFYF